MGIRLILVRLGKISTLIAKVESLEQAHKRSLLESVRIKMSDTRHELLKLLDQQSLCLSHQYWSGFYEFGNKSSRWLSHALQPKSSMNHIMQISSSSKGTIFKTAEILDEVKHFYSSLNSIQGRYRDLSPADSPLFWITYLEANSLPSISPSISSELETDFTGEELQMVIRDLKLGKASGQDGFSPSF